MFNLLIGLQDQSSVDAGRFLEYTANHLATKFGLTNVDPTNTVKAMPALVMPEPQDRSSEQLAYVGYITDFSNIGKRIFFHFERETSIEPIPTGLIVDNIQRFQIIDYELTRTHWAIKDANLFKAILQAVSTNCESEVSPGHYPGMSKTSAHQVLRFPYEVSPDPDHVAVMMPFGQEFNDVYTSIAKAVRRVGMTCQRVDELSGSRAIIDDVAGLLWSSGTVIADLTGMNPNVFYETGIAHTLNRKTLLLTQEIEDVPFDLGHIRHLSYSYQGQGLNRLEDQLVKYLEEE